MIKAYIFSTKSAAYWIITTAAIIATATIFVIPQDFYPIAYFRNVLGLALVLFLPGYAFTKMLFPAKVPFRRSSKGSDTVERVVLSFASSIALSSSVGLIMYYTPFGIDLIPITVILLFITVLFATVAVIRESSLKRTDING